MAARAQQLSAAPDGRDGAPDGARLYGVVSLADSASEGAVRRGAITRRGALGRTDVVRVRGLGAVIASAPFVDAVPTPEQLDDYRAVITALFADRAVLPAPPGTVFRSHAALVAWLELHAATLADALRFAEDRVEARVTVAQRDAEPALAAAAAESAATGDIVARAMGVLQLLRQDAVSFLVLRPDDTTETRTVPPGDGVEGAAAPRVAPPVVVQPVVVQPPAAHAAFLVARERWRAFLDAASRAGDAHPDLVLRVTGPWPPFDFVRLEFGA